MVCSHHWFDHFHSLRFDPNCKNTCLDTVLVLPPHNVQSFPCMASKVIITLVYVRKASHCSPRNDPILNLYKLPCLSQTLLKSTIIHDFWTQHTFLFLMISYSHKILPLVGFSTNRSFVGITQSYLVIICFNNFEL